MENKNAFFSVSFTTKNNTEFLNEKLNHNVDLLLNNIGAKNLIFTFKSTQEIIYFFQTDSRKRKGFISRAAERIFEEDQDFLVKSYTKEVYFLDIQRLQKNNNFRELETEKAVLFQNYVGNDIKIFDDKKNWYKWQKTLYEMLYEKNGEIKRPDDRKIIHILDKEGNSGKSSFFKWLLFNDYTNIGRYTHAAAHQLRSSLINMGRKKIYLVDLSRSRSRTDSDSDLMSATEDLKSGMLTTAMYGQSGQLLMDPPHVIIISNQLFNVSLLSEDRWVVYSITKSYDLEKIRPSELKRLWKVQENKMLEQKILKKILTDQKRREILKKQR